MEQRDDYNILIISDDYDEDLIKENYYQEMINYHKDEPKLHLIFCEVATKKEIDDNDIIVIDYGLIGDLDIDIYECLIKNKEKVCITSALPRRYIFPDSKNHFLELFYVDFQIDLMYIDILSFIKKRRL